MTRVKVLRALLRRARPLVVLTAALSCDPKETDYFLTAENTRPIGNLTGTVSVGAAPINGATIALTGPENRSTTTASTGVYTFEDLPLGDYTVTTTAMGFNCPAVTATILAFQTTTLNITCTPQAGTVNGTIRLDLLPVPGVAVTARQGTTTVASTTTGTNGAYTFASLLPGLYTIAMTPPANAVCPTTQRDVTVQSNLITTADFDCTSAPGSVTGTVRVDGVGRAGVTVTLTDGTATIGTATTVAGGSYTIPNVQPGGYLIDITPPAGTVCATPSQNVTIQSNVTATANFDCTTIPGTVTGTVRLNTVGQAGVPVTLSQGTTTVGTTTTAAGGTYTFSNVQPGTYTATIIPPAGATCSTNPQTVTVQSGQAATANFDCTSAPGSVTGAVRLNAVGQAGVTVTLSQGTTTVGTTTTAAGGTYTFSNVQPGTYTATIVPPVGATCSTNPQTVTVQSNQAATANFDCINFTITLSNPPPSYRQISAESSETCTGITTTPAQPGGTWTATWTGTGTVGATQRTGTLNATGMAVDRQPINQLGTFNVSVSVTSGGATRSATGSVTVQSAAGTCPAPAP